jgi:hypothetical protein
MQDGQALALDVMDKYIVFLKTEEGGQVHGESFPKL